MFCHTIVLSYIRYRLGDVFSIIACAIAYVTPIIYITLPCIHLVVQTSRHLLTMHEFPSRRVCFNSSVITQF
jgi:hypothetical protein